MEDETIQPAEFKSPQPNDAVSESKVADLGTWSQSKNLSEIYGFLLFVLSSFYFLGYSADVRESSERLL